MFHPSPLVRWRAAGAGMEARLVYLALALWPYLVAALAAGMATGYFARGGGG